MARRKKEVVDDEEVGEVREPTREDRIRTLRSNLSFLEGELREADTEIGRSVVKEWIADYRERLNKILLG